MTATTSKYAWIAYIKQHYEGHIEDVDAFCAKWFTQDFYFRADGRKYDLSEVKFWMREMRPVLQCAHHETFIRPSGELKCAQDNVLDVPFVEMSTEQVASTSYITYLELDADALIQRRAEFSLHGVFEPKDGRLRCLNEMRRIMSDDEELWAPVLDAIGTAS